MKHLLACILLAACSIAQAQFSIVIPGYGPTKVAPVTLMPPTKLRVDNRTFPPHAYGHSTPSLQHPYQPGAPNYTTTGTANGGQFRESCKLSHVAYDDPIVFPGQTGISHPHAFYGNTSTRSATNLANMATSGNSTCFGGTLNRTGYWLPAPIYHCPTGAGGCSVARDGTVMAPQVGNFYYKCDAIGATGCDNGIWFPVGFRMITGYPSNTSATGLPGASRIECYLNGNPSNGGVYPGYAFDHIPTSADAIAIGGCNEINFFISFPDCWNGIDLDVPDHHSHMAFKDPNLGCNNSLYPQLFPAVTLNAHLTGLTTQADFDFIRLSSDPPETSGVTQAGSTTTVIYLDSTASTVTDYYVKGWIAYGNTLRYITAYDPVAKAVTVGTAFASAPVTGSTYAIRNPAGRSLHADWVGGWSTDKNVFGANVGSVTDIILKNCYRQHHSPFQNGDCHNHYLGNPANQDDTTAANMWGLDQ